MDSFSPKYRSACEQIVVPFGFIRKKNVFIRVINDVCQSFYMERLSRGPHERLCRIGFSILPLCQKLSIQQIERGVGLYYLRQFETNGGMEYDGWLYRNTPESISSCLNEITRYLNIHLIPFFERANCSAIAFDELISLEKLFEENRIRHLQLKGIPNLASYKISPNLLDSAKYYMALKNGDYNYAKASLKALLQQNLMSYEGTKHILSEEVLAERLERIQYLKDEISLLNANNICFFQNLIKTNECYSNDSLKQYILS